jgi:alpha-ketoglutarate-dependent taurine dioxygenase
MNYVDYLDSPVIYKKLPVGEIPKTPATPFTAGETELADSVLCLMGSSFGHLVSYKQEQDGLLLQNIIPVHKTETQQISTSSKVTLQLHTENAFHPYKPDFVLLFCLRGDETAFTTYADVFDIVECLSPQAVTELKKRQFITRIDDSFRTHGEPDVELIKEILTEDEDGYKICFDEFFMRGTTQEACDALDELIIAISKSTDKVALQTGDLMVIDNRKTVHGRLPFQPRYDGMDRWVKRLMVVANRPPDSDIDGNVITTEFTSAS